MLLIIHISVALSGLVLTGAAWLLPSKLKLRLSQLLIGLTLSTGTLLVFVSHVSIVSVCVSGLIYSSIAAFGITQASKRLAAEERQR